MLFFYCLLAPACINAAPNNTITEGVNIDKEKEKWVFMCIPKIFIPSIREDFCYIVMTDKEIASSESIKQHIGATLMFLLQDDNSESIPDMNDGHSIALYSVDDLLAVDVDGLLHILNLEQKIYKCAFVFIFILNEKNNELNFKIEQVELNSAVYDNDSVINGSSNGLDILKPLLVSGKSMRDTYKNSCQINNESCDKMLNKDLVCDNVKSTVDDVLWPYLPEELLSSFKGMESAAENSSHINNVGCIELPDLGLLFDNKLGLDEHLSLLNKDDDSSIDTENNSKKLLGMQNKTDILSHGVVTSINTNRVSAIISEAAYSRGVHKKNFQCEKCAREFSYKHNFIRHMSIHTKKKKHLCEWVGCYKLFAKKYDLKAHIESHASSNIILCPECGKTFARKYNLKKHIVSKHKKNEKAN
ncbi:MAG: C2H2-type zinc finger protein [Candidatus Endonucleobacter bathymodioli]|uniref:C2H2-type zinc finger protein n=1 Tax=Candidatus Endonucleibacter bathymodioli TaxID=539814 RepID=A0AA90NVV5_9GAMM|nr:C2H2-type zinc finger protein [Candidatus Endonucleobacter bathymodioli]